MPTEPKSAKVRPLRILASPAFKSRKVNPYTFDLYTRLVRYGASVEQFSARRLRADPAPDIWHIHWHEELLKFRNPLKVLYRLMRFEKSLRSARKRDVRIVWTVHNLGPHEKRHPRLESLFWKLFLPRVDACIHLSEAGRRQAIEKFPEIENKRSAVIPHPHYRDSYENGITRKDARKRLAIEQDTFVILFIGQIRRYKNVPRLIKVFTEIEAANARLIIAGRPRENHLQSEIEALASIDSRITLQLGFVDEADLQVYLNAADIMIAPYRDIFNSGTALLSLSFDRPIIVPRAGALPELEQEVGSEWLRLYDGQLNATILSRLIEKPAGMSHDAKPDLSAFDPERAAERTFNLLCELAPSAAATAKLRDSSGYSPKSL
ncbi:glycosyltransferase [Salinisphaera sp. RV14]|uniref:glycosyltransferase n=1 Tax=unclassified Salinisphaera TaxID=2649847 RepID=UPI003F8740FC